MLSQDEHSVASQAIALGINIVIDLHEFYTHESVTGL